MLKRTRFSVAASAVAVLVLVVWLAPWTAGADKQEKKSDSEWTQLFNGKDLTGWDTWLGRPHGGKEIVGLNKDPKGIYSIVEMDGKPAIRITGEIMGALTTQKEYENYHIRL